MEIQRERFQSLFPVFQLVVKPGVVHGQGGHPLEDPDEFLLGFGEHSPLGQGQHREARKVEFVFEGKVVKP